MLLVIAAPLIQGTFQIFTPGPLYGSFTLASDTTLTIDNWLSGDYQQRKTRFINDHVGFREDLIRVNNQVDLSLFEILHADATLGKNHYLYQPAYIDEHYGKTFMGYENIRVMCIRLKFIQNFLAENGKTLLIICPPTKDDIYPEYLPYMPGVKNTQRRNSIAVRYFYDSLHLNYIDVDAIFKKKKTETKEQLFTREGIHWSTYASYFATDTIIKWLEHKRNIRLPELKITSVEHTKKPRFADNDLGWPLNLIIPFDEETYSYPVASYVVKNGSRKPSLVLVGDSFNWTFITNGLMSNVFDKWQFWYYFNDVKNEKNMDAPLDVLPVSGYNWKGALDSTDCLMLNYTPHNLDELNRFVDSAYNYFITKQKVK